MTNTPQKKAFSNLEVGNIIDVKDIKKILKQSAENDSSNFSKHIPEKTPASQTGLFLVVATNQTLTDIDYIGGSPDYRGFFSASVCQILQDGKPDLANQVKISYLSKSQRYDGPDVSVLGKMKIGFKWDQVPAGFSFAKAASVRTSSALEPTI